MTQNELRELAEDIKTNGLRDPIVTLDGKILDGRNRFIACGLAGVEPCFEEWRSDGSPAKYVWSQNYTRRHLNSSQRAAVAMSFSAILAKEAKDRMSRGARLSIAKGVAILPHPDNASSPAPKPLASAALTDDEKGRTREKLAEMAGVSPRLIQDAKHVHDESPEAFEDVKTGKLTVSGALKRIKSVSSEPKRIGTDPVTVFVASVAALKKASRLVEGFTAKQCMNTPGLAKAINDVGFQFTQLVPMLVKTNDEDALELARKTIAALSRISLEPQPGGPDDPPPNGGKPPEEPECEDATQMQTVDPKALDWPSQTGMKIVIPSRAFKLAVKRASIAAMTGDGQSKLKRSSNKTRGCVRISAADGKIVFESSVSQISIRHIVAVGEASGAAIVSEGGVCVPAKELKTLAKEIKDGLLVTMAFLPIPSDPSMPESPSDKLLQPDGTVEISQVHGNRTVAKVRITSYSADVYESPPYPDANATAVLLSGKASCLKTACRTVGFALDRDDLKEIFNKYAIFMAPDAVFFLGCDRKCCAVVQSMADSFDKSYAVGTETPILIDAEFLDPILAAFGKDEQLTVGITEGEEHVCLFSVETTCRISIADRASRAKYPNYRKLIWEELGAVLLADRRELLAGVDTISRVDTDRCMCEFVGNENVLLLSACSINAIEEANGKIACTVAGDQTLKCRQFSVSTLRLMAGLRKMACDKVRISFAPDENKFRIEDETDPKFSFFLQITPSDE